jgi:hypothetical protein
LASRRRALSALGIDQEGMMKTKGKSSAKRKRLARPSTPMTDADHKAIAARLHSRAPAKPPPGPERLRRTSHSDHDRKADELHGFAPARPPAKLRVKHT